MGTPCINTLEKEEPGIPSLGIWRESRKLRQKKNSFSFFHLVLLYSADSFVVKIERRLSVTSERKFHSLIFLVDLAGQT